MTDDERELREWFRMWWRFALGASAACIFEGILVWHLPGRDDPVGWGDWYWILLMAVFPFIVGFVVCSWRKKLISAGKDWK